jgi:prepilin-type N-terminal cleavage/methylation domain-containing protein
MHRFNTARGFTLLELLATMTIISILTMIAIPGFHEYRARGYDTTARLDLRNVALAEEAYYYDADRYLSCQDAACAALPGIERLSDGTNLSIEAIGEDRFQGQAEHSKGTGRVFSWDSAAGGQR